MARHGLLALAALGLIVPAGLIGCASSPSVGTATAEHRAMLDDATPVESGEVVVYAEGMGCPLCATNVDRTISRLPGVASVSIDLDAGAITLNIIGKQRPTRGELARAVYDAGFTVRAIEQK
ncbi:MAG: heavy-metal-associated domain-containing protein [Phycisphaerales bacterium]|jgi:copper chaperone CopZ|nr:heavy-metal-associated domain-containing protein [Phycisphaerales bacterium]